MGALKYVYAPQYEMDLGPHVFPTQKYRLIRQRLLEEHLAEPEDFVSPPPLSLDELLWVHTREYLEDLKHLRRTPRTLWSELPLTHEIVEGFALMASGTWKATQLALQHRFGYHIGGGFHHAFADHAEGFCYIHDMAYAIRKGQQMGAFQRVAVVDCDVHQGNGTARIFRKDERVFTFSIHQEDLYPVPKEKSDLDIGLPAGADDELYLSKLKDGLETIHRVFQPDIVFYQAGADPYEGDQLGDLQVTKEGLEERDRIVLEFAVRWNTPVVITLGGGYAWQVEDTVTIHVNTAKVALEILETHPWNP